MVARKNRKNKTAFVGNVTPSGLGIFYSVPLKGNTKVGQKLTLKVGGERIDLTGSQVRALQRVITRARRLASR